MKNSLLKVLLLAVSGYAFADGTYRSTTVDINCEPLNPPRQTSTEVEARAKAGVETLLKRLPILSGEGGIEGKFSQEDLLKGIPNADRIMEAQLRAYLVCEAIRQSPNQTLELLQIFYGQILPAYGQAKIAPSVVPVKPFPNNGRITLLTGASNLFDRGTLFIELDPTNAQTADDEYKKDAANKAPEGPAVSIDITYKPKLGPEQHSIPQKFHLNDVRKYNFGDKKFSLKFVEYYDGSGSADFEVQQLK